MVQGGLSNNKEIEKCYNEIHRDINLADLH